MNNLSTATSTNISGLIGALELGDHMDSHSDGALEEAGVRLAGPTPTQPRVLGGACASDGALEAAGATMNPPIRTQIVLGTICR
jgi:hypothetical protein